MRELNQISQRRRESVVGALQKIGVEVEAPEGTVYITPSPEGLENAAAYCGHMLKQAPS